MKEQKGLYGKYIVTKTSTGEPVDNCFILRPDKDKAAIKALMAYTRATDNEQLAEDIMWWLWDIVLKEDEKTNV